ncbi:hypothetical protein IEO21_02430 [Rhodonia placenta]|uniref:SRR1-like domain-containing protein n=1 Tax=Rhodonia placenta TaxID=104341 RepID=A0A8H7P7J4_9APHY|nr:hypothetical protein IEO21_02430 [Postia placenta]
MADAPPTFGYADSFTPTRTRKKRRSRLGKEALSPAVLLDRATEELTATDWLRDCKQLLRDALASLRLSAHRVLCLGLGSPAASRDARAQLAFLLAVCDDLSLDRTHISVYDPVFTADDTRLLDALGVHRLAENRACRFFQRFLLPYPGNSRRAGYAVDEPTIVFMPHCDLHLYENLFRENWTQARLPNLVLIANRLSEYAEK